MNYEMTQDKMEIYSILKKMLKKYEDPMICKAVLDSKYDLWSVKDLVIEGRKRKEVYFAGLAIQSNYVGLYYMPVYIDEKLKNVFHPDVLGLLKGKCCFHIKKLDKSLEKNIEMALEKGYELYLKNGWV